MAGLEPRRTHTAPPFGAAPSTTCGTVDHLEEERRRLLVVVEEEELLLLQVRRCTRLATAAHAHPARQLSRACTSGLLLAASLAPTAAPARTPRGAASSWRSSTRRPKSGPRGLSQKKRVV